MRKEPPAGEALCSFRLRSRGYCLGASSLGVSCTAFLVESAAFLTYIRTFSLEQVRARPSQPAFSLGLVFDLGLADGLPLHVGRVIGPATFKGPYVVYDVAGTASSAFPCRRTGRTSLERGSCRLTSFDSSALVQRNGRMGGEALGYIVWAMALVDRACSRRTSVVGRNVGAVLASVAVDVHRLVLRRASSA